MVLLYEKGVSRLTKLRKIWYYERVLYLEVRLRWTERLNVYWCKLLLAVTFEVGCDSDILLWSSRILYIHILIPADVIHMSENRESWILIIQGKDIRELFECWSRGRKRLQGCVLGYSGIFVRRMDIYWDFIWKHDICDEGQHEECQNW